MLHFEYPEFLLLALPLAWVFRRWCRHPGPTGWIRATLVMLLVLALSGPGLNIGGKGIDVIVLVDRSRSMPDGSVKRSGELISNLENNRGIGDRVAVVAFGGEPQVENELSTTREWTGSTRQVDPDGSDLDAAIRTGLNLVDPSRPARMLVLSDGEANGRSPSSAARRAREAGVPIDFRLFERQRIGDVAVDRLQLPRSVAPREPFQFSVWIASDGENSGTVQVLRDGEVISRVERRFRSGRNRLLFRDVLEAGGVHRYSVRLQSPNDAVEENNVGAGVVRVEASLRLLVLNANGLPGNLVRALESARLPVDVAKASAHPLSLDGLDAVGAVIIENVPASDLGRVKMERLAQYVEDLGGGLMLTGGERSFGTGGYFHSPLDGVMPVSMELREEHRRMKVAMAVALDRSGSMAATVSGGKTKMDLANLGTAECISLLSPSDSIAVIAVDSSPHVVVPLVMVSNPAAITRNVRKIESDGGGIYIYEALVAAGKELQKASGYSTRHILLFSDAADSEEPGNYKDLLAKYARTGITVSVIGLGSPTDQDAGLLKDIAERGRGNILFTKDPQDLPRLFAQDTISMARNTFIRKDQETQAAGITARLLPDARLIGNLGSGEFPNADGYNLCYLKPDATLAVVSQDRYRAPWAAAWHRGLGRVAALTLEVDGPYEGAFGRWDGYADFLVTHARWLLGANRIDDVFVSMMQDGQDAVVTVELDAGGSDPDPPTLVVVPPGEGRQQVIRPTLSWTGPATLEARFRLTRTGTYRTLVRSSSDRRFTRGPVVTLPYSPEYVSRIDLPTGRQLLQEVARLTHGEERTDVVDILSAPPRSASRMSLLPWLFGLCVLTLVTEIGGRRLGLWERTPTPFTRTATGRVPTHRRRLFRLPRLRPTAPLDPTPTSTSGLQAPQPDPGEQKPTQEDIFRQAKTRARSRLK